MQYDTARTLSPIAIGGTWQIPQEVLAHNVITLYIVRYSNGQSVTFPKDAMGDTGGSIIVTYNLPGNYWVVSVSGTGLVTIGSGSTASAQPHIFAIGYC